MPMQRGKGSTAKVVELARTEEVPEVPNDVAASPLYGVAMLKIAMELKKAPEASLEALITGVLKKMKLPEEDFRGFLAANGGLLRTIAMKRKY